MRRNTGRADLSASHRVAAAGHDAYYGGLAPAVSAMLSIAGVGWHIDTGIHCIRLILGGVFDQFPRLQIIVGHQFEALSWMAWRTDYLFPLNNSGGLKRTIKEYLRENFYGDIVAGEDADQPLWCGRSRLQPVLRRHPVDIQWLSPSRFVRRACFAES
jgi:hypothetical protein